MLLERLTRNSNGLKKASKQIIKSSSSETICWDLKHNRKSSDFDNHQLKMTISDSISLTLEQTDTSVGSDDEEELEQDNQKPHSEPNETFVYEYPLGRWRREHSGSARPCLKVASNWASSTSPISIRRGVRYPHETYRKDVRYTHEDSQIAIKAHNADTTSPWSLKARIVSPRSNLIAWARGQPAEVRWQVLDHSIRTVQIDVCNLGWTVPTTITFNAPNTGSFVWRKVAWGMPSSRQYYINIYSIEYGRYKDSQDINIEGYRHLVLIGQSEEFTVMNAG
ncbi:hypothetical protein ABG067_004656 [Albugo candida]